MVARFRRGTFRVHAGRRRGSGADQVDTRKTLDHLGWRDGFGSVLFGNDHDGRGKPVPDLLRGCVPMENDPVQTRVWRDMFGTLDGTRKRNVSDMQTRNHRARLESSKSPMRAEGTRDALRRIRIFCEYSLVKTRDSFFLFPPMLAKSFEFLHLLLDVRFRFPDGFVGKIPHRSRRARISGHSIRKRDHALFVAHAIVQTLANRFQPFGSFVRF